MQLQPYICGVLQLRLPYLDETTGSSAESSVGGLASRR